MGFIFKDTEPKPITPKAARTRVFLLSLPFALMGIFALVLLMHDGLLGGLNRQKTMGLLSAALVCGGLIALIFGVNAKKMALQQARAARTVDDRSPWLKRKEWTDGRIMSLVRKPVVLVWILVIFWCVVMAVLALLVLPPQLKGSQHPTLVAMIFPLVGLAVLIFTFNTTQIWRRFGQSVLMMGSVPAGLGGVLTGVVEAKTTLAPEHGWRLRLTCLRRTNSGASNNRQVTEKVLWRDEQWLRGDLPKTDPQTTGIPIYFKLPEGLPESAVTAGDGFHWRLEVYAKLRGPDFTASFELPVFRVVEPSVPGEDPTKPYQVSLDDIREQIQSHIEVKALAEGGKEFIFPAGRNPGAAAGATAVFVIWTGIIALLFLNHGPLLIVMVFSIIDLLMAVFVADLWLRRNRVVINAEGVTTETAWLPFRKQQQLKLNEVKMISADVGATVGHVAYYDLRAHLAGGKEIVLAKSLKHQPEAEWLVRHMQAELKAGTMPVTTQEPKESSNQ